MTFAGSMHESNFKRMDQSYFDKFF